MNHLSKQNCLTKSDYKFIFDTFYEKIRNFIYYKCGNISKAEDIAQDVFLIVWEKIDSIKMETISGLLYKIASNLYINTVKKEKVTLGFKLNNNYQDLNLNTPEFEYESEEFNRRLQNAISALPEKLRLVFLMNRIDDLKYIEISENLGITVKAVEKRMQKALSILKKKIGYKL